MKRKILSLLLLIMLAFAFTPEYMFVSAETVLQAEPAADTGGLWHVEDGNKAYVYMRYNNQTFDEVYETGTHASIDSGVDYSTFTKWMTAIASNEWDANLEFQKTSLYNDYVKISNPNPQEYDKFVIEIIPHLGAPAEGSKITHSTYADSPDEIEIFIRSGDTCSVPGCDSYFEMYLDDVKVLSNKQVDSSEAIEYGETANPDESYGYFGVSMYWQKTTVSDEVIDVTTDVNAWDSLPLTTGNPVNPGGEWGHIYEMSVTDNNISFDVEYDGTVYQVAEFAVTNDLDFIKKTNDVLYYTDPNTNDRILYFNFGETLSSAILAHATFDNVTEWKGEALWNLTQGEVKVTDTKTVYHYIPEVDSDGNVYSYFYMPDVPIDDLISVTSVLAYRYWSDPLIGTPSPGETQYKTVASVKGETTSVNPSWVETAYKTSAIAGAAIGVGMVAGVVPVYGWAVAAGCFMVAGGILYLADTNEWFAYDIDQIAHVSPSTSLVNDINTYIYEQSGSNSFNPDTDRLYKLHLAQLDGDDVEIMEDETIVTQVVWETDGEIYVLNDEYIDTITFGPGTLEPEHDLNNILGINDPDTLAAIKWGAIGIGGFYILTKLNLKKNPGLAVLLIAAVVFILFKMGLIV